MAHTPGPWEVQQGVLAPDGRVYSETKSDFWVHGPKQGYDGEYENPDDARLIAAAPDLLEQVVAILEYARADPAQTLIPDGRLNDAEALVAKVLGE